MALPSGSAHSGPVPYPSYLVETYATFEMFSRTTWADSDGPVGRASSVAMAGPDNLRRTPTVRVVEKAGPAVVNIFTEEAPRQFKNPFRNFLETNSSNGFSRANPPEVAPKAQSRVRCHHPSRWLHPHQRTCDRKSRAHPCDID